MKRRAETGPASHEGDREEGWQGVFDLDSAGGPAKQPKAVSAEVASTEVCVECEPGAVAAKQQESAMCTWESEVFRCRRQAVNGGLCESHADEAMCNWDNCTKLAHIEGLCWGHFNFLAGDLEEVSSTSGVYDDGLYGLALGLGAGAGAGAGAAANPSLALAAAPAPAPASYQSKPKPKQAKPALGLEGEINEDFTFELREPLDMSELDHVLPTHTGRPEVGVGHRVKWLNTRLEKAPEGLRKVGPGGVLNEGLGNVLRDVHGIIRSAGKRGSVNVQWFTTTMGKPRLHETPVACLFALFTSEYSLEIERWHSRVTR